MEETGQGFELFAPIAQNTEREYPELQVAGESPAGDTSLRLEPAVNVRKRLAFDAGYKLRLAGHYVLHLKTAVSRFKTFVPII